jgi:hypothetical protein
MDHWRAIHKLTNLVESLMSKSDFNVLGLQFEDEDVGEMNDEQIGYYFNSLLCYYASLHGVGLGYDDMFKRNHMEYRYGCMNNRDLKPTQMRDIKQYFQRIPMDESQETAARLFRQALTVFKFAIHAKWHELYHPKFYFVVKKYFYRSYWYIKYHADQTGMVEELQEKTTELRKLCIEEFKIQLRNEKPTEIAPRDIETDPKDDPAFVRQYTGSDTIDLSWMNAPATHARGGGGDGKFGW